MQDANDKRDEKMRFKSGKRDNSDWKLKGFNGPDLTCHDSNQKMW